MQPPSTIAGQTFSPAPTRSRSRLGAPARGTTPCWRWPSPFVGHTYPTAEPDHQLCGYFSGSVKIKPVPALPDACHLSRQSRHKHRPCKQTKDANADHNRQPGRFLRSQPSPADCPAQLSRHALTSFQKRVNVPKCQHSQCGNTAGQTGNQPPGIPDNLNARHFLATGQRRVTALIEGLTAISQWIVHPNTFTSVFTNGLINCRMNDE